MRHDIGYNNAAQGRWEADETMLRELNELKNEDLTCNELCVKYFIRCIIAVVYYYHRATERHVRFDDTVTIFQPTDWPPDVYRAARNGQFAADRERFKNRIRMTW